MTESVCTELDFTEHWSFYNVQQEVLRGIRIREEKINMNNLQTDYDTFDINISKPSCSKRIPQTKLSHSNQSRPNTNISKNQFKKIQTHKREKRKRKHNAKTRSKAKVRQCPLRVFELAEPMKRYCLNTWKNNSHTLPVFMIARLRHRIMDEKPVVHITEAANYFKTRKVSTSRRLSRKPKRDNNKDCNVREMQILSSIFGYKIKQKLQKPIDIQLNTNLENLNDIVSDEIYNIFKRKKTDRKDNKIQTEIAKKVTIWIASILEETSYRLLLDELNDLEEEAGPVLDFIDQLLYNVEFAYMSKNNLSDSCEETDKELKSQINVMVADLNLSNTSVQSNAISELDTIIKDDKRFEISEDIKDAILPAITNIPYVTDVNNHFENSLYESIDQTYIKEDMKTMLDKVIYNIINNDFGEQTLSLDKTNEFLKISQSNNINGFNEITKDIDTKIDFINSNSNNNNKAEHLLKEYDSLTTKDKNIHVFDPNFENENTDLSINIDNVENDPMNLKINSNTNNQLLEIYENGMNNFSINMETNLRLVEPIQENLNKEKKSLDNVLVPDILDRFEDITQHDSAEDVENHNYEENNRLVEDKDPIDFTEDSQDNPKKVKFSNIHMGAERGLTGITKYPFDSPDLFEQEQITWKYSQEYIKSHFDVAPPNPNLLNDADELWPENILPPLLKATESVIKSVTSLGRILETDEHSIMSPEENDGPQNIRHELRNTSELESLIINNVTNYDVRKENYQTDKLSSEIIQEHLEDYSIFFKPRSKVNSYELINKNQTETLIDADETTLQSNTFNHFIPKSVTNKIEAKTNVNIINYENVYMTKNKKVQTSAARIFRKDKVILESYNVHKWCLGLLNVTTNLMLWATWIENVCENAMILKQKESREPLIKLYSKKYNNTWINFNNNIEADKLLWCKLHQNLKSGLMKYRNCYKRKKIGSLQSNKENRRCNCAKKLIEKMDFEDEYLKIRAK